MKIHAHWPQISLEEVASIQTGLSKSSSRKGEFVSLPYLRVANVQDGHFNLTEIKMIDVPINSVNRYSIADGDVLLTEGGDFDKLGRGAIWRGQITPCVHQNHIFVVRPDTTKLNTQFFAYQTSGPRGRSYFQSCSKQSTNLASINSTQLRQFPTLLPPLREQRKIADILSTWDESLKKSDALILAKQQRKKALIQQLLTGKKRLLGFDQSKGKKSSDKFDCYPADWNHISLGEITQAVTAKNTTRADVPVLSSTKHHGLVRSKEYFGKKIYADDTSGYRVVERYQFAYATNHIEEGSIGYQDICDVGLVSPIYTVFNTCNDVDDSYLFRVLKSPLLIHQYRVNTSSSVARRGSLRYKEFAKIKIWLPSKPEQRAIAAFFDTCDEELKLLSKQRETINTQKRGLMQRLLTGKIRTSP